ncbi:DUF222 domain-containing protein, partial [Actinomycetospora cinnamomea]|uniref:DUF222 domain-containing protein n=1 Tax=Actinomycetospora cinnamomea TaxID=663609 RepID=UPI00105803A4
LEAGRVSLSHVRVVIEQTEQCSPGSAREVDAALWSRPGRERTPAQLRETVRRLVARVDPEAVRRRVERARRSREFRYWSEDDGAIGVIQMRMPADQARGVVAVVDALARGAGDAPGGERRSLAQRRVDTARDLILDGATTGQDGACCCAPQGHDGHDGHDVSVTGGGSARDDLGEDATPADTTGEHATEDAAGEDAATEDAAGEDAGGEDAGGEDAGGEDAGGEDAGGEDAGGEDAGGEDAVASGRDALRGVRVGVGSPVRADVRITIGWMCWRGSRSVRRSWRAMVRSRRCWPGGWPLTRTPPGGG